MPVEQVSPLFTSPTQANVASQLIKNKHPCPHYRKNDIEMGYISVIFSRNVKTILLLLIKRSIFTQFVIRSVFFVISYKAFFLVASLLKSLPPFIYQMLENG